MKKPMIGQGILCEQCNTAIDTVDERFIGYLEETGIGRTKHNVAGVISADGKTVRAAWRDCPRCSLEHAKDPDKHQAYDFMAIEEQLTIMESTLIKFTALMLDKKPPTKRKIKTEISLIQGQIRGLKVMMDNLKGSVDKREQGHLKN